MLSEDSYPSRQWFGWAQAFEHLQADLVDLGVKRSIHKAHQASIANRSFADGTGIVHRWLQDNYADSMLIGLRRLVDRSRGTFSLVRVLEDLKRNHSLLSLDRFLALCSAKTGRSGNDLRWRSLYKGLSDGTSLDRQRITTDIEKLEKDHETVLRFTNSVVAHRRERDPWASEEEPAPTVTWSNLDELFEDVSALFNRYYTLMDPGVHVDFESVLPAGYDQAFIRMLKPELDGA